jgi:internalin A
MQTTHQFFLTKRSLYLLVLDNRKNEQQNRLEYWLKLIETYGGNSPVIIVGNCADEHPPQVKIRISKKYPQITKLIATSCKTGAGIVATCAGNRLSNRCYSPYQRFIRLIVGFRSKLN